MSDDRAKPTAVWVSDAVVDLLVDAGIDRVAFNPGATFRGLHDSLVHHRSDAPRIILCPHEGISVAIAHGHAQATGTAMAVLLHNVVGLQHASMAIYNAWCDRVPIVLIGGTGPVSTEARRPWIDWIHTALVQGEQVRDYVKWDDQPADAASVPGAFARAWKTAHAEPTGPVYVCLDAGMQEEPFVGERWRLNDHITIPSPPAPRADELARVADVLRTARAPILVSDYSGATPEGFAALVRLAELTGAAVIDRGARLCFPTAHPQNMSGLVGFVADADAVVGVDVEDLHGALSGHRPEFVAHLTTQHLKQRSWSHDYGALAAVDLHVTADGATALAALGEQLEAAPPTAGVLEQRRGWLGTRAEKQRALWWREASEAEAEGAVHPGRLAAELWPLLAERRWTLVYGKPDGWERRLWRFERARQHLGWHGGGGLGHGLGAAIGATLASEPGTLCVSMQPDGDLLYTPSALWTAANQRVPLLIIVQNNRQYGNTVGHAAHIARDRNRAIHSTDVGAALRDPSIDFVKLAQAHGVWATGPISRPEDIAPAAAAAIEVVDGGTPALVEVLTPQG